jgi:hypothetical protein
MAKYNIDVIIAPSHSFLCILAPAAMKYYARPQRDRPINIYIAGYPVAMVPLGQLDFNGQPISLSAVTIAHNEGSFSIS